MDNADTIPDISKCSDWADGGNRFRTARYDEMEKLYRELLSELGIEFD